MKPIRLGHLPSRLPATSRAARPRDFTTASAMPHAQRAVTRVETPRGGRPRGPRYQPIRASTAPRSPEGSATGECVAESNGPAKDVDAERSRLAHIGRWLVRTTVAAIEFVVEVSDQLVDRDSPVAIAIADALSCMAHSGGRENRADTSDTGCRTSEDLASHPSPHRGLIFTQGSRTWKRVGPMTAEGPADHQHARRACARGR